MLSKPHDYGKRLLPVLIDRSAQTDHDRVYASISTASDDVVKGFRDITYKQLSNAIDHAAFWLDGQLGKSQVDFETFAYFGPRDLRYPILTVAAAKVGRKVLLPSLLATLEAQNFLAPYTWLQSAIGSTEGGIWPTSTVSGEDWSYMYFHPLLSARFEPRAANANANTAVFELIVDRTATSETYTNLYSPGRKWAIASPPATCGRRTQTRRSRTCGATPVASTIWSYKWVRWSSTPRRSNDACSRTRSCMPRWSVGRVGRARCYCWRLRDTRTRTADGEKRCEKWCGRRCGRVTSMPRSGRVGRELVLIASADKPFVRLGKGSVDRRSRFKLYEREIKNAHVAAAT
ncbi:hypothetical protein LTR60_000533 [Cryomyces antarcticus]|nr:hypothetical protein LTR60_000533 [Cryomyces antarcticus]